MFATSGSAIRSFGFSFAVSISLHLIMLLGVTTLRPEPSITVSDHFALRIRLLPREDGLAGAHDQPPDTNTVVSVPTPNPRDRRLGKVRATSPGVTVSGLPKTEEANTFLDWRAGIASSVRADQPILKQDSMQTAVRNLSTERATHRRSPASNDVREAFEMELGARGEADFESLGVMETPDGMRVEKLRTPSGTYCFRMHNRAVGINGIDPFVTRDTPVIAQRCR